MSYRLRRRYVWARFVVHVLVLLAALIALVAILRTGSDGLPGPTWLWFVIVFATAVSEGSSAQEAWTTLEREA